MKNKRDVILTGGLGLLGSSASQALNNAGYSVIIVDKEDRPDNLNQDIGYIKFNLMDVANFAVLKKAIKAKTDNLKCLINLAAYNPSVEGNKLSSGKFEDQSLEEWNDEIYLNVTSPMFLIKELLDLFNHKNSNCKIVNIISIYGMVAPRQEIYESLGKIHNKEVFKPIGYSVSKAALAMVTKYLATYLGDKGFNVNGLAPGGIENNQPKEFIEAYSAHTPMKRMAKVEDMLGTLLLLCGEDSDYINGQIFTVDGGWTTW